MDTLYFACTLLALPLATLAVGVSVWLGRRSSPEELRQQVNELRLRCEQAEAESVRGRTHWAEVRTELDSFFERCEDALDAAERKRRRAAASASRANGNEQPDLNDPAVLRQIARQQGML